MIGGGEGGREGEVSKVVVEAVRGCPQQENGYDCGMYVLSMTKYLAHLVVTQPSGGEGGRGGGKEGSPKLDTMGLAARVTPDAIDEARRRIGLKIQQLASTAGGGRS